MSKMANDDGPMILLRCQLCGADLTINGCPRCKPPTKMLP